MARSLQTGLLFRAFLFSLLMVLPGLLEYIQSDGFSPLLFNDWDEPYYLPLPVRIGTESFFSYIEHIHQSIHPVPHKFTDFAVSRLLLWFSLSAVQCGLLLDFACVFSCYLTASLLFFGFTESFRKAELIAIIIVTLPWVASFSAMISIPIPGEEWIVTRPHKFFPSLPSQRAVYTQCSLPLFLLVLSAVVQSIGRSDRMRLLLFAGLGNGLLLYSYFFSWLTGLFLACGLLVGTAILSPKRSYARLFKGFCLYLGSCLLVSTPGLYMLLGEKKPFEPGASLEGLSVPAINYSAYWYLPLECLLALIVLLAFLYKLRGEFNSKTQLLLFISVLLAGELVLTNIQPLLGKWMAPYHYTLFYIHPLLGASLFSLAILNLPAQRFLFRAIRTITVIWIFLFPAMSLYKNQRAADSFQDLTSLFSIIHQKTDQGSTIAAMPYGEKGVSYLLLPYWIEALTGRNNFSDFIGYFDNRSSLVEKEMALGLLYTGSAVLVAPCKNVSVDLPGDVFSGANFFIHHTRLIDCALFEGTKNKLSSCDVSKLLTFDYFVHDEKRGELPSETLYASTEVGRSSHYVLYELNRDTMIHHYCSSDISRRP